MKALKMFTIFALVFMMASCVTTTKFPVSTVTPAADIVFKNKHDKNGNIKITVIAKNLASVDRIAPPENVYVLWLVTEKDGVRNIGVLKNKNAKTTGLETLSPFKFTEAFITAEHEATASFPSGIEISRIRF